MRGDAALRQLEYLALLNRICRELRLQAGVDDKVLGTNRLTLREKGW